MAIDRIGTDFDIVQIGCELRQRSRVDQPSPPTRVWFPLSALNGSARLHDRCR